MMQPIRVGADFGREFPGADPAAAEVAANLVRAASAFLDEVERRRRPVAGLSAGAYEALAVLEGAGEPLPGHVIAERLLVTTASVTSLLDTLVRRGFVTREPHPTDRRKILVRLTAEGQRVVDEMLPIVHRTATDVFGALTAAEAEALVERCTEARRRLAELAALPPPTPRPRRVRRRTLADAD
ncbi:MAG: MarR family winged helix-turn-helix transcriptional regulator [Jatrophihabitans sp.]|uniref:MarR family winged helix-turn-helix transcriptional regulator n=1 Tax=Jatrophihabitans sp. TaxID=1932789 RepID=UPI003F7EB484